MIFFKNKRCAYGFGYAIKPLLLLLCLPALKSHAQDTVSLLSVEITARKNDLAQIGKKTETIDSTLKEQFKFNSISDALSFNSSVFIKSYGPGQLATTAFRGGNASQTALLWNGFNLQNAMLGQADLALMPAVLFENIEIEYGGSSSLWGTGAVGGSIHLDNKLPFGKGIVTSTNLGTGSFGLFNGSTNILISKQRFISSTKLYITDSQNNFNYKDTTDKTHPIKKMPHANYDFKGLMQEFKFLINANQILSVNAWLNSNHRRLPDISQPESKAYQYDAAVRLTANWNYFKNKFKSNVRGALFYDRIDYTDSVASVFSKSKARTVMAENENYLSWHRHNQFNFGASVSSSSAFTDNYESTKTLSRVSLLAGNKFSLLNDRLITYLAVRAEYFSVGRLPLTGNASAEYKLMKNISVLANVAKVYRQPTLNELYWLPGGNIHLKPEQGYTYEGTVNYKKQSGNFSVFISSAVFSRRINNWILWVPGANGTTSPVNIQQVWSRGAETTWKLNYQKNKLRLGLGVITSYVLSTVAADNQENASTIGKQLIFTPRYTVNANITAGYGNFNLVLFNQYIGYRFITSDNSEWLNPYTVSSLRLNYQIELKKINLILYTAANNLFNVNYNILDGRPMPLRNYEFGITIRSSEVAHNLHQNK